MTPVALKLVNEGEGYSVKDLTIFLTNITEQTKEIEKKLSLKMNEEILQLFHEKHHKISDLQSFIRTLERK